MRIALAARPLIRDVLAGELGMLHGVEDLITLGSTPEVMDAARGGQVDLAVCDADLADDDLVRHMPGLLALGVRVLVVSDYADTVDLSALLLAGASGCLVLADAGRMDLTAAVQDVAAGHAALHPAAAAAVLREWRLMRAEPPVQSLSRRESEVLAGLADGLTTRAIGTRLEVSPKTVEVHVSRVLAKLGVRNRAQAVAAAIERGLLPTT